MTGGKGECEERAVEFSTNADVICSEVSAPFV